MIVIGSKTQQKTQAFKQSQQIEKLRLGLTQSNQANAKHKAEILYLKQKVEKLESVQLNSSGDVENIFNKIYFNLSCVNHLNKSQNVPSDSNIDSVLDIIREFKVNNFNKSVNPQD